jgi:sortase A
MRALGYVAKFLISVGVGILLFVAWTLWGTGLYTERQQRVLAQELDALPPLPPRAAAGRSAGPPPSFDPAPGAPVFRIAIERIGVDVVVVEGVGAEQLRMGPGHYPACDADFSPPLCTEYEVVWPGEPGRVIVSGHRTTYGAPFWDLDELAPGDRIEVDTRWGDFTYEVRRSEVVPANSRAIVVPSDEPELVLTTCNPRFSASERLIVFARLTEARPQR